jgi:hypothetical protein
MRSTMHMNHQISHGSSLILVEMFEVHPVSPIAPSLRRSNLLKHQAKDSTNTCNEDTSAILTTEIQGDSGST